MIEQPKPIADGVVVSCSLCRYYKPSLTDKAGGQCHRHNPSLVMAGMSAAGPQFLYDMWPSVTPSGWCGDGLVGISADSVAIGQAVLDAKAKGDHGGKG